MASGKQFFPIQSLSLPKRSAVRASSESNQTRSNPLQRLDGRRRVTVNSSDASSLPTLNLLERLGREMPEVFGQAQVVGKWVWLESNVAPVKAIRDKLKELGFHWNAGRKCWQHPIFAS